MASPVKLYQREMHDNLGFFATWLPADPIEIGDAGLLVRGRFRKTASLEELGISHKVVPGRASQNVQYTSTSGTKLSVSGGATAAAVARAEISIEFSRSGAFVFHASSLRPQRLENRQRVADELLKAYEQDKWKKEWLLVEALHTAEQATIVVSDDRSAGLVLRADVAGLPAGFSLADPKVNLTVASTWGKVVHIVGGRRLHPLYTCLRLKDPLIGKPSVQPVRGQDNASPEAAFTRPAIDDLLRS